MKYIVDRIEDDVVVLEDMQNDKFINIPIGDINGDIHDGSILIFKDNQYFVDVDSELERRKKIEEKFRSLRSS